MKRYNAINMLRFRDYAAIARKLGFRYSPQKIGEIVELIEATSPPEKHSIAYDIWKEWEKHNEL
jgi:hypothetical protein